MLRKKGLSYNEINKVLNVSKSTLSTWLKDMPFSQSIKRNKIIEAKKIWAKNISEFNKKRSLAYQSNLKKQLEECSKEVPKIDKKALFWLGLALFWAEGGKREKWMVRFTYSDPKMIKIMMRFFREICNVNSEKIKLRVHLYPEMNENKIIQYWSKITNVLTDNFYKSQIQVSKSGSGKRPKNRLPYGTLHITILDSSLIKKIKGWNLGLIKRI